MVVQLIYQLDTGLGQVWSEPVPGLPSRKSGGSWHFTGFFVKFGWGSFVCDLFLFIFPCEYYQRKYIFSILGHTSFYVHCAFGSSSLHLNVLSFLDLVIWDVLSLWMHCCVSSQSLGFTGWDAVPSHWRSVRCGICFLSNVEWTQVHWLWRRGKKIVSLCLRVVGSWSLFALWSRAFYLIFFFNTTVDSLILGMFYTWMRLCCTGLCLFALFIVSQKQKS